jgi:hypothetical protein
VRPRVLTLRLQRVTPVAPTDTGPRTEQPVQ